MVGKAIDFFRLRKWQIIGSIILLILVGGIFLPRWMFKLQINKMELDKVERVEYVEYEGDPFCSAIKIKKVANRGDNGSTIENFIGKISTVNKQEEARSNSKKVMFFYYDNGEVLNAYIKEDCLGFNYGKKWLRVKGLGNFINSMNPLDRIKFINDIGANN